MDPPSYPGVGPKAASLQGPHLQLVVAPVSAPISPGVLPVSSKPWARPPSLSLLSATPSNSHRSRAAPAVLASSLSAGKPRTSESERRAPVTSSRAEPAGGQAPAPSGIRAVGLQTVGTEPGADQLRQRAAETDLGHSGLGSLAQRGRTRSPPPLSCTTSNPKVSKPGVGPAGRMQQSFELG